jgi:hypothetical protein
MNRRELVSQTLVVRSRDPKGSWIEVIDLATAGQVTRTGLAARGSRSPPG